MFCRRFRMIFSFGAHRRTLKLRCRAATTERGMCQEMYCLWTASLVPKASGVNERLAPPFIGLSSCIVCAGRPPPVLDNGRLFFCSRMALAWRQRTPFSRLVSKISALWRKRLAAACLYAESIRHSQRKAALGGGGVGIRRKRACTKIFVDYAAANEHGLEKSGMAKVGIAALSGIGYCIPPLYPVEYVGEVRGSSEVVSSKALSHLASHRGHLALFPLRNTLRFSFLISRLTRKPGSVCRK